MQNRLCGGCGYDLMGISPSGQCPECGRRYDLSTGHGTDARTKPWLERYFRTAATLCFALAVMVCSGLISLAASRPVGVLLGGLAIAGVVLVVALYNYTAERKDAQLEDEANGRG